MVFYCPLPSLSLFLIACQYSVVLIAHNHSKRLLAESRYIGK